LSNKEADLESDSDLEHAFKVLKQQMQLPQINAAAQEAQCASPAILQVVFATPCEVTRNAVLPLQPAGDAPATAEDITLDGQRLRPRHNCARPLPVVLNEADTIFRRRTGQPISDALQQHHKFQQDLDALIDRACSPKRALNFSVLYKDALHTLTYNRGNFVLIRGPVENRNIEAASQAVGKTPLNRAHQGRPANFYVGVAIVETSRARWLAIAPRACQRPEDFWTNAGIPVTQGICVGDRRQFTRLATPAFLDEEALVQWLDAGVTIATQSTIYHQRVLGIAPPPRPRSTSISRRRY
jgi:hypothetical protein